MIEKKNTGRGQKLLFHEKSKGKYESKISLQNGGVGGGEIGLD